MGILRKNYEYRYSPADVAAALFARRGHRTCRCRCWIRCCRDWRAARGHFARCQAAPHGWESATISACCPICFSPKAAGAIIRLRPIWNCSKRIATTFSVFSGVSHPNVDGGHPADVCFLTAAPHPGSSSFRNTISLDQYIAEANWHSDALSVDLLWASTRAAAACRGPAPAWRFRPKTKRRKCSSSFFCKARRRKLKRRFENSIQGAAFSTRVADQAKELQRNVGARDRDRLDQYFTSVRDLENRLQASRGWEKKPKPVVNAPLPIDPDQPGGVSWTR